MKTCLTLLLLIICSASWAVEPDEILPNSAQEKRARELSRNIRCLVCEGEVIDESNAPFARHLRSAIRQKIEAGASDGDIIIWLRSVYGEGIFVHSSHPWHHLPLWLAPFLFAACGLWWLWRRAP